MAVLGPNDPRGIVRKATAADRALVESLRPKSLPNAEAVILGTGEVGFRVNGKAETDALLKELAAKMAADPRFNVVGPRPKRTK